MSSVALGGNPMDSYNLEMAIWNIKWASEWKSLGCEKIAAEDIIRAYNHIEKIRNDALRIAMMQILLV